MTHHRTNTLTHHRTNTLTHHRTNTLTQGNGILVHKIYIKRKT